MLDFNIKLRNVTQFLVLVIILNTSIEASISTIIRQIRNHKETENEEIFHKDLLRKFYKQKSFEAILSVNKENQYEYCHKWLEWLKFAKKPVTVITGNVTEPYGSYFNNEILAFVCSSAYQYDVLEQLAEILNNMRYTRIIVIMDIWSYTEDIKRLKHFFKYCHQMKMLNVVVIFKNFYRTRKYCQYTIFPEFQIEYGVYKPKSKDFLMLPDRLKDLKGYKLRTIADHIEPRSIEYYDRNNQTVLLGYLGRFVKTISSKLNATLYFPVKVPHDMVLHNRDIIDYVEKFSLDIPISSSYIIDNDDTRDFSYPVEIGQWCLLLPMERRLGNKEIFLMILRSHVMRIAFILIAVFTIVFFFAFHSYKYDRQGPRLWSEIIVNDMAIRGVLGQSFILSAYSRMSIKQIYLMLLLSGLAVTITFGSYLLSFSTSPPFEPKLETYEDLLNSQLKIAIIQLEYNYLHSLTNGSLSFLYEKFHIVPTMAEFSRLRYSFDPRYVYPTPTSKIFYYIGLELYYGKKFYRWPSQMCPLTIVPSVIPLGKNSFFSQRLHELTLLIMQSGLLEFWSQMAFSDVIAAGRLTKLNITYNEGKKPLCTKDFYWIWLCYTLSISFAVIVFVLEWLVNRRFEVRFCFKQK